MPIQIQIKLNGTLRDVNRKSNRELRANRRVPAVLYGPQIQENIFFSVDEIELERILNKNRTKLQILVIDGKEYKTLLKRADFDPVTDRPIHIDFYVLSEKHKVTLNVPIKTKGSARGVIENGGRLFQPMKNVRIRVLPEFIPEEFIVDVTPLKIGEAIHVRDLNLEGIEPIDSVNRAIAIVQPPKSAVATTTEDTDEEHEEGTTTHEGEGESAQSEETASGTEE